MKPPLQLSLQFADAQHRSQVPRHFVARCIRAALAHPGQITVRIVGAEEGQMLNREYRQQDHATNVLTFDYQHAPIVMADLILCAPVIAREAKELRIPLAAPSAAPREEVVRTDVDAAVVASRTWPRTPPKLAAAARPAWTAPERPERAVRPT